jgi:hypothetical protein
MTGRHAPWLLSVLLVSACQSSFVPSALQSKVVPHRRTNAIITSGAAKMLQAPNDAMRLQGTVQLDASYAIAKAGATMMLAPTGRFTSTEGGKLVGTSLIGNDGSTVIAHGGGNVIVDPSALIGNDGGTVISNDGGTVISNDGGTVIAQGGGNVIAQGGGNAVATHATGFHVAATNDTPALGDQLPAAGMVVQVRTLRDNKRVAIGIDAQGRPAYALYTNLEGKFELFLPRTLAQNVRIIAMPRTKNDPKLRYAVMGMAKSAAHIDEDTSQVTGYILASITGRVRQLITHTPEEIAALAPVFGDLDAQLAAAGQTGKVKLLAAADQDKLAQQVTNVLLESIDMSSARFDDKDGQSVGCVDAITQIVGLTRDNMGKRMVAIAASGKDPATFFAAQDFMKDATTIGFKLEKPADFMTFLVQTQLNHLEENELVRFQRIHNVVLKAGLPTDDERMIRLALASNGLLTSMAKNLKGATASTQAAIKLLRSGGK